MRGVHMTACLGLSPPLLSPLRQCLQLLVILTFSSKAVFISSQLLLFPCHHCVPCEHIIEASDADTHDVNTLSFSMFIRIGIFSLVSMLRLVNQYKGQEHPHVGEVCFQDFLTERLASPDFRKDLQQEAPKANFSQNEKRNRRGQISRVSINNNATFN